MEQKDNKNNVPPQPAAPPQSAAQQQQKPAAQQQPKPIVQPQQKPAVQPQNPAVQPQQRQAVPQQTKPTVQTEQKPVVQPQRTAVQQPTQINANEFNKLKLIYEIIKQFQGTLNLKALMNQMLDKILEELQAEAGTFFLVDDSTQEIVCTQAIGPARDKVLNLRIPKSSGVVGWCIDEQKTTIIYDTSKDKRFSANVDEGTGFITKSIICVPIVHAKRSLGAVELFNKKSADGKFNDHDLEILKVIADNAAMSLNNAKAYELENKLKERSQIMNEFAKAFSSTLNLDQLLKMVLQKTTTALKSEAGSIWLIDEKTKKLLCKIAEGPGAAKITGIKVPVGTGIVGTVVKNKKMEVVLDAEKDKRFAKQVDKHTGFKTKSMLCIPFIESDKAIGCIQIMNKKTGSNKFDKDDVELLNNVATIAAISIKNASLYEKEKKIGELSALLKISKEISSSLDLDSVAVSVVNLTSQIIEYDRAILLTETKPGKYAIAAVSGMGGDFTSDNSLNQLLSISTLILENKKENYFPDIDKYNQQPAAVEQFKKYFQLANIKSFYCNQLSDGEGNLGIIIFESKNTNVMPQDKREVLDILCTQISISLRNAQLYQSVPKFDLFGAKGKKKSYKKYLIAGIIIIAIIALNYIPVNYTITSEAEIIPLKKKFVYPQVEGLVKNIYINDGEMVEKGKIIAEIDDKDFQFQLTKLKNQIKIIKKDILKFKMQNALIELTEKENEKKQMLNTIKDIEGKIEASKIVAPLTGQIILKDALSKVGEYLAQGAKFAEIVDLKKVKVKLLVPEDKVRYISKNLDVNLKFAAFPKEIMKSKIEYMAVEGELNELSNIYYYPSYLSLVNENNKLKISMSGNARIKCKKISILNYLLEAPKNYFYMKYKW